MIRAGGSGGNDGKQAAGPPGDTVTAPVEPAAPVPAEPASGDADLAYIPDPSMTPPAAPEAGIGSGDRAIPAAIQGRWALKAQDCAARPGTDLTALVIDAKTPERKSTRLNSSH